MINFSGGGMMGDFIQTLYAVKNICEQRGEKANLYIGNAGDVWRFGVERAHSDLYDLIMAQPYINKFEIFPSDFNEPFVDLNTWRGTVAAKHAQYGSYNTCWSEVLARDYHFTIPSDYKWLTANTTNEQTKNKTLIHRSKHRHNGAFPWNRILGNIHEEILFVTTAPEEWNMFPFKFPNIKPLVLTTITELAGAIGSCKRFIGNQSAPFSLACALDVPRLVELDYDPAAFYMDETKYSNNISWFLNDSTKFFRHGYY